MRALSGRSWYVLRFQLQGISLTRQCYQAPDGTKGIPVGKTIALLAEEGDNISNLEAPTEDNAPEPPSSSSSSKPSSTEPPRDAYSQPQSSTQNQTSTAPSTPAAHPSGHPHSSKPLFPSVLRLVLEHNLSEDVDSLGIKGTGIRGMITKGDILTHLGLAQGPNGTFKEPPKPEVEKAGPAKKAGEEVKKSFTGDEIRKAILAGLQKRTAPVATPSPGEFRPNEYSALLTCMVPRS